MATQDALRVRCPECGANSDTLGEVLRCSYCGTTSRVQRRTQFGMKVPLPPRPPDAPRPVAVQVNRPVRLVLGVVFVLVAVSVVVPVVVMRAKLKRVTPRAATVAASEPPSHQRDWATRRPLVADLDDDGVADAIGIQRDVIADQMFLVAVSGATGSVLWRTPSLGTFDAVYRRELTLAKNGVILVGDRYRDLALVAFEAANGKPMFTATFGEVVDKICATEAANAVNVITKDKVESRLDLASGQVSPVKRQPRDHGGCAELSSTEARRTARLDFTMKHSREIPGMSSDTLVGREAPWIVTGVKQPGSRLPMIAALDDKDHVLWTAVVPQRDPMSVKFEEPAATDVEGDTVATVYIRNEHEAPVLAVFDRKTGARRYETLVAYRGTLFVTMNEVVIGKKMIFITMNEAIQAFDRETGARKWVLGETR
ncbi:hypothetical protein BH11MYX1_BH11MYX1_46010 [soil metagenome]